MAAPPNGYDTGSKIECAGRLERTPTASDAEQPALPSVHHRRLANPSPLGLFSFATNFFLISCFAVHTRGVTTPNVLVGVIVFFGGVAQILAGIGEFMIGNTFGATVFPAYGCFNLSYALIFLPGSGILASYTDPATGQLSEMYPQALAMYLWGWFVLSVLFTAGTVRSSWVLLLDFICLDLYLLFGACSLMTGNAGLASASAVFGFGISILSFWAGVAGLYIDITPWQIPVFELNKKR